MEPMIKTCLTPRFRAALLGGNGSRHGKRAFTLVELVTVLGIMLILAALAFPSIAAILTSSSLTESGQILSSQISLARQIASSRGYPVEVRLIQSPTTGYYYAIQLFAVTSGGTLTPANHLVLLPAGAVISASTTTLSPYLANLQTGTLPQMNAAGVLSNYVSFRISPNGLVDPYPALPSPGGFAYLYLTVVPLQSATVTTAPSNYVTVQINPVTGSQLVYRP
jgi:uncharacterized protein (TIGR02596 family)